MKTASSALVSQPPALPQQQTQLPPPPPPPPPPSLPLPLPLSQRKSPESLHGSSRAELSPNEPLVSANRPPLLLPETGPQCLSATEYTAIKAAFATLEEEGKMAKRLIDIDRDTLAMTRAELLALSMHMFFLLGVHTHLGLSGAKILDLLVLAEAAYMDCPYHTFRHAVDVAYFATFLISVVAEDISLTPDDTAAVLLAALCHDTAHPGRNNLYLVNSMDPLVVKNGRYSALEIESAEIADCVLADAKISVPLRVRLVMRACVLYTDVANHFELVRALRTRTLLLPCLLHAADISNALRAWPLCRGWSALVIREFCAQRDAEIANNLPVTVHPADDEPCIAIGFYDSIVLPYFSMLATAFFPGAAGFLVSRIRANRAHWCAIQAGAQLDSVSRANDGTHDAHPPKARSQPGIAHIGGLQSGGCGSSAAVHSGTLENHLATNAVHESTAKSTGAIAHVAVGACASHRDSFAVSGVGGTDCTSLAPLQSAHSSLMISMSQSMDSFSISPIPSSAPAGTIASDYVLEFTQRRRISVAAGTIIIPDDFISSSPYSSSVSINSSNAVIMNYHMGGLPSSISSASSTQQTSPLVNATTLSSSLELSFAAKGSAMKSIDE